MSSESELSVEAGGGLRDLLRATRPRHWAKSGFVVLGPIYGYAFGASVSPGGVLGAVLAFGLAASAGYVLNDLLDREADRKHARKRERPLASGRLRPAAAGWLIAALVLGSGLALLLVPPGRGQRLAAATVGLYLINSAGYSLGLKHVVILDGVSLALGFVLRVLGGCAAALVVPSTWLLNCTFFLALFLAFGKRLGERRTLGERAAEVRPVLGSYSDELLRLIAGLSAMAALALYAAYVQSREPEVLASVNLLWLTLVPAAYGLLRAVYLLDRGVYDDPTELATRDPGLLAATVGFAALTAAALFV